MVEHGQCDHGGDLLGREAMIIEMVRDDCNDQRTLGTMTFPDGFSCHTLEDPVRDGPKVYGDTAIPSGSFKITISRSKKFNKLLPMIHAVPGFGGVRIHCGNNQERDTSGCILVGMERDASDGAYLQIRNSRDAMREVQPRISDVLDRGEEVWLDIITPRVTTEESFALAV